MSLDAQHRAPRQISRHLTELAADRLRAYGYCHCLAPDFHVIRCPRCNGERSVRMRHELLDGEWRLSCSACGHSSQRDYFDPITAIAAWNCSQVDHETTPENEGALA